jgi:VCBS repeat protein/ASPIC/UnbV protein
MKTHLRSTINLLALGMILATVVDTKAQTTFTKITSGDLVNDVGPFGGFAWGDFNNDGFLDLFASFYGGTNVFYRNNRDGTFGKVPQGDPDADNDYHVTAAAGDFDNDGYLDLLVAAGQGAPTARPNMLYHNDGDGTFSRVSGGSVTNQLGFSRLIAWADYDNDGFLDFFVDDHGDANDDGGRNLLFHNNGNGTFTKITSGAVFNDISVAYGVQWADYDNDGFMDLLVMNNPNTPDSINFLYHNERNGVFRRVLTNAVATDLWPQGALTGAWGDYDNDGFQDLFITGNGATNRLYHNNGDGTFTNITAGPMLPAPVGGFSFGCAWGDFDNDGHLDLFVSNADGKNGLFHNNGDGTFTQVLDGDLVNDGRPGVTCRGCSWVDYDNDGFLDLFFTTNPDSDSSQKSHNLYHNDGNSNAWLEVKCIGTVANRSAIGTKVRVKATIGGKSFWQLREINDGGGSQVIPLVAHFGMGDATNVDIVRIEWPSGTVQEFPNVAAKRILTFTEPPRLHANATNGVPHFYLKGGRYLQYDIQASTDLRAWSRVATVTITNLAGTAQITDTNASPSIQRFYRAVSR